MQTWQNHVGLPTLHDEFVKDAWRKKEVVSALFLDIKNAFLSIIPTWLIHDMRDRGVPAQYTNWLK